MIKYYLLLITLFSAMSFADCVPVWQTIKKDCQIYNPCPSQNESLEWSGACEEGKANGSGILKWFENGKLNAVGINTIEGGKISEKTKQVELLEDGVFIGYEKEAGLVKGALIQYTPVNNVYIGSFKDYTALDNGVLIFPEKLLVSGGKFNPENNIDGDGFYAFLAERIFVSGVFQNGQPQSAIKTEFHKANEKGMCDIATSLVDADSRKYTGVYKGLCGFKTELPEYRLVAYDNKIWLTKNKDQNDEFFLTVGEGLILSGRIGKNGLEGEGIKITKKTIETGFFRHSKLVDGWQISNDADLEKRAIKRILQ